MAHEPAGHTLQATALVHEAYLRLVPNDPKANVVASGGKNVARWEGKGHFYAAAAEAMRRILVEQARRKCSLKHGGHWQKQDIALDQACFMGCCVPTGWGSVTNTANVQPGDSVAVYGLGGVGLNCLRAAVRRQANPVIAVDLEESKEDIAMDFGATHFIDSSKEDPVPKIQLLTGDVKADDGSIMDWRDTLLQLQRSGLEGVDLFDGQFALAWWESGRLRDALLAGAALGLGIYNKVDFAPFPAAAGWSRSTTSPSSSRPCSGR